MLSPHDCDVNPAAPTTIEITNDTTKCVKDALEAPVLDGSEVSAGALMFRVADSINPPDLLSYSGQAKQHGKLYFYEPLPHSSRSQL